MYARLARARRGKVEGRPTRNPSPPLQFQSANRSTFPPFKGGYSENPKSWPLHDQSILFAPASAPTFDVYDFRDNKTLVTLPARLRWRLPEMVLE